MRKVYDELRTPEQVQALRYPEGLSVEYKGNFRSAKSLAKTCCAFANTNGGLLVIGVANPSAEGMAPREFPGVPTDPDPVQQVDSILVNTVTPRISFESKPIEFADDQGRPRAYVLVYVQPSAALHQVSVEDVGTFYQRVGRNSVPMSPLDVQQRVEAMVRHRSDLLTAVEERISWPQARGAGVITVVPAAPFSVYGLDPAAPQFRGSIQGQVQTLTLEAVRPSKRGCLSVANLPEDNVLVGVERDGACQMLDTRLVDGRRLYYRPIGIYSATAPITVRRSMSEGVGKVGAGAVYGQVVVRQLVSFFSVCNHAYTLMHYDGPVQIRVTLKPADSDDLVLEGDYLSGDSVRLLPKATQDGALKVETNSFVTELGSNASAVARRLVTHIFESFGIEDLSEDTERELSLT